MGDDQTLMSRRTLVQTALGGAAFVLAPAQAAGASESLARSPPSLRGLADNPEFMACLKKIDDTSKRARTGLLAPSVWQDAVASLLQELPPHELRAAINFDDVQARFQRSRQPRAVTVPDLSPLALCVRTKVFAFTRGHAILPHGHNSRLSAFYVLSGKFHGRHFARLRDLPDAIVIRPTIDRVFTPGMVSTISDERDNVHWFTAVDGPAYLLNLSLNVHTKLPRGPAGRVYLDPTGERLRDGTIHAPRTTRNALRAHLEGA